MSTPRPAAAPGPRRVTFRVPKTPAAITVTITGSRVTATLPGYDGDLYQAGRTLAALGAPPPWWPYLRLIGQALRDGTTVTVDEVADHLATPAAARETQARRAHDLTVGRVWLLARDPEQRVRYALARHFPDGPRYTQIAVVFLDDTEHARNRILERVTWSEALDHAAAHHADPRVRAAFARRHPDRVRPDWFDALAVDPSPDVRRLLASKQRLPAHLVDRLAADPSPDVRRAVARDQALSPAAADALVTVDPGDAYAIEQVLRNRSCPAEVWDRYLDDDDPRLAGAAWVRAHQQGTGRPGTVPDHLQDRWRAHLQRHGLAEDDLY